MRADRKDGKNDARTTKRGLLGGAAASVLSGDSAQTAAARGRIRGSAREMVGSHGGGLAERILGEFPVFQDSMA